MIQLKTIDEIKLMRESAQLVSKTLGMLAKEIKPGITTKHLDKLAFEYIKDHGAEPAFLGYGGFQILYVCLRMSRLFTVSLQMNH
jgi:methionyl aminopeptidase